MPEPVQYVLRLAFHQQVLQISCTQAEENGRHPHKIIDNINSVRVENKVIKCEVKENGWVMDNIKRIAELANIDQPRNLYLVFQEEDYQKCPQQRSGAETIDGAHLEINISPIRQNNRNDDKQKEQPFRHFFKRGLYRFKVII